MKREQKIWRVAPRERVLAVRGFPALAALPLEDIVLLAELVEEREFSRGDVLLAKGESIEEAYLMLEGRATLERDGEELELLEAPGALGLIGALAQGTGPRGDIIAVSDIRSLALPSNRLFRAYENNSRLTRSALAYAAGIVLEARRGLPYDPARMPESPMGTEPEDEPDFVDRLTLLAEGIFEDANLDALAEIARAQEIRRYEAGDLLWAEEDKPNFFVRILYGQVDIERSEGPFGEAFQGRVGANYSIGLFEGLAARPRTYRASARTPLVTIHNNFDDFVTVFEDHFDLSMTALATISQQAVDLLWSPSEATAPRSIAREAFDPRAIQQLSL